MKRMEATLGLLARVIGDEKSFIEDHTEEIISMVRDEIRPLKHNVRRIKRLIKEWNSIPRGALLLRAKFITMDLGEARDLKSGLSERRKHLVYAMQVISFSHDAAQSVKAKEQAIQRHRERDIEENARKLRDAKEELHRLQTLDAQNRIYELLKKQQEKEPDLVSKIAESGNIVLFRALEKNLVESGIPSQDVRAQLGKFLAGLRQESTIQSAQNKSVNSLGRPVNGQSGVAIPRSTGPLPVPQPNPIPSFRGFRQTLSGNNNIDGSSSVFPLPASLYATLTQNPTSKYSISQIQGHSSTLAFFPTET